MNPWNIIGWTLVFLISIPILVIAYKITTILARDISRYFRYLKTRNNTPQQGQTWVNGDYYYKVDRVTEEGVVILKSGSTSFGRSAEDWKKFIRGRRLRRAS